MAGKITSDKCEVMNGGGKNTHNLRSHLQPSHSFQIKATQSSTTKEGGKKETNKTKHICYYKTNTFHQHLAYHEMFRSLTFQRKGKTHELHEQFILMENTSL